MIPEGPEGGCLFFQNQLKFINFRPFLFSYLAKSDSFKCQFLCEGFSDPGQCVNPYILGNSVALSSSSFCQNYLPYYIVICLFYVSVHLPEDKFLRAGGGYYSHVHPSIQHSPWDVGAKQCISTTELSDIEKHNHLLIHSWIVHCVFMWCGVQNIVISVQHHI